MVKTIGSLPVLILFGYLTTRLNLANMLLFSTSLVILFGYLMAYNATELNFMFSMGYILSQLFDSCNFIITQTMIMIKMAPESRGMIICFQNASTAIGLLLGA